MLNQIFNYAQGILAVGTIVAMVSAFTWFVVDEEVSEKLARITGAAESRELIENNTKALKSVQASVDGLEAKVDHIQSRVDAFETPNRIFEIDMIRSLVHEDCPTEGNCTYTWRAKRTAEGSHCDAPVKRLFVIDRFGVTHPVSAPPEELPNKAGDDWSEISGTFILPDSIPVGVAEFYIELNYTGCFPEKPEARVRERTPNLTFIVNPH
jgi:hypothetical protein